jgi:hypothetical protein
MSCEFCDSGLNGSARTPTGAFILSSFTLSDSKPRFALAAEHRRPVRVYMRRSKGPARRSNKPRGPGSLSDESSAAIEKTAAGFGLYKARAGQALDDKYNSGKSSAKEPLPFTPPGYKELVAFAGVRNLQAAEKVVFGLLVIVFSGFLSIGLAISSLAFFKATAAEPPAGFENFVSNTLEGLFTPSLLAFFGLSIIYGLYKQAQLNSGVTSYTEISKDDAADE